jgi:polar amino acid transport system substrate-binding protein
MTRIFFILIVLCSLQAGAQNRELKLVADVWPLFTNLEGEKSVLTDLVGEALGRIQIQSNTEILESPDILQEIYSGKFDGSPSLWINDERKEKLLFSKPYLYNQLILVGRKGSDVSASSLQDLKGKRIGVVKDYAYGDLGSMGIITVHDKSNQENLEKLLSDKIDYMLVDALLIHYMLKYQVNNVTKFLAIGQKPLLVKSLHLALNKKVKNARKILDQFDREIEKMIGDESFNKILELNWVRADVDGDGKTELVLGSNMAGTSAPRNIYGLMMDDSYLEENKPQRYYVDGKLYESWDNVPHHYKLDLELDKTPSLEDTVVKFNF